MPDKHATAPYTAIRLPDEPLLAEAKTPQDLPRHDRFDPDRLTGYITLTSRAVAPVFCGTGTRSQDGTPQPSAQINGQYVIPDRTMTGMVRATLRQITGARLPRFDPRLPAFRQPVAPGKDHNDRNLSEEVKATLTTRKDSYTASGGPAFNSPRLAAGELHLAAGQLHRRGTGFVIIPVAAPGTRELTDLAAALGSTAPVAGRATQAGVPNTVWRDLQYREYDGCIVYITGTVTKRKNAFLFSCTPDQDGLELPVPAEAVAAIDQDAATIEGKYQRENWPDEGRLLDSFTALPATLGWHPVWFTYTTPTPGTGLRDATIQWVGRSRGFRVPRMRNGRQMTVTDAVPPAQLHPTQVPPGTDLSGWRPDVVAALMGDIDLPAPWGQITRRVHFSHQVALGKDRLSGVREVQLWGPHHGNENHRLMPRTDGRGPQWTDEDARIRGTVRSLPRDVDPTIARPVAAGDDPPPDPARRGPDHIRPLKANTWFRGRVWFTNLTRTELDLLVTALLLDNPPGPLPSDPVSVHSLGGVKPGGFGALAISPVVHVLDPDTRYHPDTGPGGGFTTWEQARMREAVTNTRAWLRDHGREDLLDAVMQISQWRGRLKNQDTATMPLHPVPGGPTGPTFADRLPLPLSQDLPWPDA